MKIYQAGPLFTQPEQTWHRATRQRFIDAGFDTLWPGDLLSQADIDAWGADAPRKICETDRQALETCDVVVALLDGVQVDDGTAWEIGYAFARNIPVIGIRTDCRQAGETAYSRVNAMIEGSCIAIVRTFEETLQVLSAMQKG